MWRKIFIYGSLLAAAIFAIQYFKLQYFSGDLALEFYSAILVAVAIMIGIWVGVGYQQKGKQLKTATIEKDENKNHQLSRREVEVLQLMAKGLSNQEIADQLFVSVHTVKTHTTNIYEKLQVNRRTQAIIKAREYKVI